MLKKIVLIVGLVVGLMMVGIVSAQDTEAKLCDPTVLTTVAPDGKSIQDALSLQMDGLEEAAAAGDVAAWLKAASDLRLSLGLVESECAGRHFSSEGKGLKSLVGPIALPDGIWKASLRTDGMITTADITSVNGDCYEFVSNLFMVSQATLDVAQEALMKTSGGCIAMIEVNNVGGKAWDLTIEPISLTQP